MKPTTSSRRQLVMGLLLGLAVIGAGVRYWAPNPSLLRDIGTLLLVMWLPAVGNLIAFLIHRFQSHRADFAPGAAFVPHLSADLTPLAEATAAAVSLDAVDRRCTVLVGSHGFSARLRVPTRDWLRDGSTQTLQIEFLRPLLALAELVPGTEFHLLVGVTAVGRGRVLQPA